MDREAALPASYSAARLSARIADSYLIELVGFFGLLVVALLDRMSPPAFSLVLLYLLPLGAVAWYGSKGGQWRLTLAGICFWTLLNSAEHAHLERWLFFWLVAEKALLFGLTAVLIRWLRSAVKEQRKLGRAVAERLRVVEQLAAGVAHEVRNPLGTLLSGVEYLKRHERSMTEQLLVDDMYDAVIRAEIIVRDLNDFSAPLRLDLIATDIGKVVDLAVREARAKAEASGVAIDVRTGHSMIVPADQTRIVQVLVNLLRNAIDVSPAGSAVSVTVRQTGTAVAIDVDDEGPGIPPAQLAKVFEPFFTTKAPGAGTGLGLSVSRRIVEDHHGELQLINRAGHGLRASLILPIKGTS